MSVLIRFKTSSSPAFLGLPHKNQSIKEPSLFGMHRLLLLLLLSAHPSCASASSSSDPTSDPNLSVEPDDRISTHESIPSWESQTSRIRQLTCSETWVPVLHDDIPHAYAAYYDQTNDNLGGLVMRQVYLLNKAYSVHYIQARDCGPARVSEHSGKDSMIDALPANSVNWTKAGDPEQIALYTLRSVR